MELQGEPEPQINERCRDTESGREGGKEGEVDTESDK